MFVNPSYWNKLLSNTIQSIMLKLTSFQYKISATNNHPWHLDMSQTLSYVRETFWYVLETFHRKKKMSHATETLLKCHRDTLIFLRNTLTCHMDPLKWNRDTLTFHRDALICLRDTLKFGWNTLPCHQDSWKCPKDNLTSHWDTFICHRDTLIWQRHFFMYHIKSDISQKHFDISQRILEIPERHFDKFQRHSWTFSHQREKNIHKNASCRSKILSPKFSQLIANSQKVTIFKLFNIR